MPSLSYLLAQVPILGSVLQSTPDTGKSIHINQHCPNPGGISCPFPPPKTTPDACCVNYPSGHFLQTQFWDTSPPLGPNTSFSIHGLWPDRCEGGFDQFCDSARSEHGIRSILASIAGKDSELLEFMDLYWLSADGNNEHLWAHEWNKHGTCISTIEPSCYGKDTIPHADLYDYFVQTTSLFRTLDTFSILSEAGILPSSERTYDLAELEEAIESSSHGFPVTLRCRSGELNEIWYHFSVRGSLRISNKVPSSAESSSPAFPFLSADTIREHFVPANPDGAKSNCPAHNIKYLPKHSSKGPQHPPIKPTPTTTSSDPSATSTPFKGKGHLEIHLVDDSATPGVSERKGCLIRNGQWYTSGSCATYLAQPDVIDPGHQPLFSLSSSFSPCSINPSTDVFECTKASVIQGIFSSDLGDSTLLSYRNSSKFFANALPARFGKADIFANNDGGNREIELEIRWVPV
ncbi:hypothetical protein LTR84_007545 [Exophiala bonariae]|uniref:Ribonuclease T2-like n=1 Tax=Exophiala bonariae TaxID=1690606 RepID=A0AAV9NN01_9EURO|nr:hypothetical protein LTR84_007545 [Exophiala bonariae]